MSTLSRIPPLRGDGEPVVRREVKATLFLLLLLTLTACSTRATLYQEIDRAEQQWQAQGIESYSIEVREINSIWHAQTQTVTVSNGVATDSFATCIPAPFEGDRCEVTDFDPQDFTVEALFARAWSAADRNVDYLTITFDPTYGYPASIGYNHPDILDEDWSISVMAFEPLP